MALSAHVESYKFWDVVTLWARERFEHEEIVARALAKAVICDGLALHSVDPRWLDPKKGQLELHGYPYVGYRPVPDRETMILRAEALEHLLSIVHKAATPSQQALGEEFIAKIDFQRWLARSGEPLPTFWFGPQQGQNKA